MLHGQVQIMAPQPDISVVMSVYNGAEHLCASMDSILLQEEVSLELIVVNDGSTDDSGQILDAYAQNDHRITVIHEKNQGLTRALIAGCSKAKGTYIARIDADDIAYPGRLVKQLYCLHNDPGIAFVSCGTRFVGPAGEFLYDIVLDPQNAQQNLLSLRMDEIKGVSSHGSTMFPRILYEKVGGYRHQFYFAQDLDLWIRLAEIGRHHVMQEVLHQTPITLGSISGQNREKQIEIARLILECARLRRKGDTELSVLTMAEKIGPKQKQRTSASQKANELYFVGMCLKKNGNPASKKYFKESIRSFPFHLKSWCRLFNL